MNIVKMIFTIGIILVAVSESQANVSTPPLSGVVAFPYPGQAGNARPLRDYAGPNHLASDDEEHHSQNESAIFINPSDPSHIVGGSNDYREGGANCGWFVSFDRGETWESGLVDGLDMFGFSGDPTVVIDNDGIVYMGGIHFNRNEPRRGAVFVSRSEDGGLNWEDPSWVVIHEDDDDPPFEDKPFLGIDNSGGDNDGNIYVSWTRFGTGQIYFSRSTDGAESWSEPMRLTASRGQGSVPVVGPDGEIYVIWKNYSRDQVVGRMSDDGGDSFSDLFVIAETDQLPGNLEPTAFRTHSLPSCGVDNSEGDNRGRVYVTWADHANDDADILLAFSDDQGENWAEPLRLNDDDIDNGLDQFFPWLSVDPINGNVSAIWNDRRNDDDNIMVDIYGITWNGDGDLPANQRISSESFDPRIDFDGAFFGDYIGVAAYDGFQIGGWCDTRAENQDIYAASLDYRRFPPMDGEDEHLMIVESVIINGEAAQSTDEIAVFDQVYEMKGSALVGNDDVIEFTAYGEGWPHNENMTAYICWKVWDQSAETEYFASPIYLDGDEFFRADGETTLNLIAPPPDQLEIELAPSWNIISTYVNPHNLDPWEMFMPIREQVFLVRDYAGRFMVYNFDFSQLPAFDVLQGYFVKVTDEVTLDINGIQIDAQTPLLLDQCWNLIGYPPDYELEPWYAFESILDQIIIVKDEEGRFLVPELDFSNLENLRPGEGYLMKVCEDVELIFPEEERFADEAAKPRKLQHFIPTINSPVNLSLLIEDITPISGVSLPFYGEIAAVSSDGIICGATVLDGLPPFGMAVWGDDSVSTFGNSLQPGDDFILVYWDKSNNTEYLLEPPSPARSLNYQPDGLVVTSQRILEVNSVIVSRFTLNQAFPNPFNSTTKIGFSISQSEFVDFSLYDISGRTIKFQASAKYEAGAHFIEIDGASLNSGLYIVIVKVGERVQRTKLALIR